MAHYVEIDVSLETVNICIVDDEGTVCLERKTEAEPEAIIDLLKNFGLSDVSTLGTDLRI
ncbi:hypothetical protein [Roseinatronobacter alkalisoli]|uniref:IS110 family transposase n=1 Tax=Roseinatronobacter alkalisoli TaxID=3028235 RepID=A0ABT5TA14_9RHOB|nr:hypothetical protein [Roseinatronobacter sp. HJB301]MDD7971954.1 hypothetical protein [Roseinatronobacter sp. HJB301]